jgi:hypothetical protein
MTSSHHSSGITQVVVKQGTYGSCRPNLAVTMTRVPQRHRLRRFVLDFVPHLLVLGETSAFCSSGCSSVGDYSAVRTTPLSFSSICMLPHKQNHQRTLLKSTKWNDVQERPMASHSGSPPDDGDTTPTPIQNSKPNDESASPLQRLIDDLPISYLFRGAEGRKKLPPLQVDDTNVLLYDVFLIVNLSLSISFWVTHRVDFSFLPIAFSEGCLFSLLWIGAGLYHGSFLRSAVDGHYPPDDETGRGGPLAAAALAFNTYINAINLRLIVAFLGAWVQHRQVGMDPMEELIPLEVGCGLALMTLWRALHSSYTPRM